MNSLRQQIAIEQQRADALYARIDDLMAYLSKQLASVIAEQGASTHQNRSERDSFAAYYEDRLALLHAVRENALFGRLDLKDGETHYIGRVGVFTADRQQLLVDWRAPAAAAFYQATPRHDMGVSLRRHILTHGRRVDGVEDDVLDPELLGNTSDADPIQLQGEGALLSAVNASRTGRMGDIVATIQAEQDRIIRHGTRGVLVVQGGPGTGKTAVALHRAAYQLYTHRKRLEASGVLIVAPTRGFLRYIERVLPSLGETGLVMLTPGEIFPSVTATAHDDTPIAITKGSLVMCKVLKRAIRQRQLVPSDPINLNIDGVRIRLTPEMVRQARSEARAGGRPHNQARTTFVRAALDSLVEQYQAELKRLGHTYAAEDRADLVADLRTNHDVKVALNRCWLPYTPQSFLRSFFADHARLVKAAGKHLRAKEAAALERPKSSPWTIEDVPLLDEVGELLGDDGAAQQREAAQSSRAETAQLEYADKVLDMLGSDSPVSAKELASHIGSPRDTRTLADKAMSDRTWTYGHIVVDEAQELSPMMWRVLMRKNPTKSFTIVGDTSQTSSPSGARSWAEALGPFVDDRATVEVLTVNYRTPTRIMKVAQAVARAHDLQTTEVSSVRDGEHEVRFSESPSGTADALAATALGEAQHAIDTVGGRVALIAHDPCIDTLMTLAIERFGHEHVGEGSTGIDKTISVMSPMDAKGLEFDASIVVDPRGILESHNRGIGDLYVAMTRPTQLLTLVFHGPLPAGFPAGVDAA